jgi:hypothetical protein
MTTRISSLPGVSPNRNSPAQSPPPPSSSTLASAHEEGFMDFMNAASSREVAMWIGKNLGYRGEQVLLEPPRFSGGRKEDPKTFIKEFNKAAKANRWITLDRCL